MPPASYSVRCRCGREFPADAGTAGRRVRCRQCGAIVTLNAPASSNGSAGRARHRVRRRRSHRSGALGRLWKTIAPRRVAAARGDRGPGIRSLYRRASVHRSATDRRGERVLAFLSWGYLVGVAAVSALMWGFGDSWWPATVLLFMGRWVFLLPLALLLPAALVVRPRHALPLLLGTVIVLGPLMGGRLGWPVSGRDTGLPAFRAVTFNAGGEAGSRSVAYMLPALVADWDADVVAFQECAESLAERLSLIGSWHYHVQAGLCLLSRHPITDVNVMDRQALERVRHDALGVGGAGYVVRYRIATPNGDVWVTNVHLETPRKGLEGLLRSRTELLEMNTAIREIESRLARSWVDSARGPAIVLGDFNTPVESRIYRDYWGDMRNAFSEAGRGFGYTRHNGWIRVRIDHVLATPEWAVRGARTGADFGSDHRPLIADLVLTRR